MAREDTQFKKGKSGNPNGRPPAIPPELKALCREQTAEAVATFIAIMKDKTAPQASRIAAANALLDRGYGKAAQPLTNEDGSPLVVSVVKYADSPPSQRLEP